MRKQEVVTQIFTELLEENLLNEADSYDVTTLKKEVEGIISRKLEDYVFVYRAGILEE